MEYLLIYWIGFKKKEISIKKTENYNDIFSQK